MIQSWPYPVVAALEPGRTSWTAVLDAVRFGPADDRRTDGMASSIDNAGTGHRAEPELCYRPPGER